MSGAKLPKIIIGYRVGKLCVEDATPERKNGYTVWRCRCDCGNEICLDTRALQRRTITDCGCSSKLRTIHRDLRGQRFGKLIALEPTDLRRYETVVWRCRCDCGGEVLAPGAQLTRGYVKSCGCLSHPPLKELVGKRFGKLTVIAYEEKRAGLHRWRCRCDCGKETVVGQTLLQSGKTKSCGCLQASVIFDNMKFVDGTSVASLEAAKTRKLRSNTSGYNGVYLNRKTGKWNAQITFKGKTYFLGSYTQIEDAVKARRRGEEMYDSFLEWYYAQKNQAPGD